VVGASTIARDITEHKRAAEEIRKQAGLLDLAPALARDMDNRIELWTRGAEQLYGYTKEEALGRSAYELLKTDFPQALPEIEKTLNSTGIWEGELRQQTRGGKRVVVACQWVLHRDAKGKPARVLEVNADITALKQAEALQMRSQKLESLGTLAGGIAHDFNNILSAINGSATLAISQFPPDHPVQACLVEIEKAGARAADLVRRILSFSRPQDRNMEVQALEPVVEEALKLVRATLPAMIEIRAEFGSDLPKARVDATQIYQVIVNLVTNAAHAIGDKPGLVEVRLDAPTVNEGEILLYEQVPAGDYLRLSISDNGCGMDKATVKRIFDPFFTTKPAGKGTGLGLSVVHGIVAAHHAVLKVYSEPGKGTTFRIYFPAVREATAAVRARERSAPSGFGERILFVDDEGVLVFVGTMSLEQNGYKVTGTPNGEAALREVRKNPDGFDAVVTDLSMPGMSGLQLAHEICKMRPDIPVILTSGYINPEDQAKADRLGIRAILTKPVNTKELLATLAALFEEGPRLRGNLSS
jgi:PAS domain S-box-containing protein